MPPIRRADQVCQFVAQREIDFESTTGHISEDCDLVIDPNDKKQWGPSATFDFSQLEAIGLLVHGHVL